MGRLARRALERHGFKLVERPVMSSRYDRRARKFATEARRKREDATHMAGLKSAYWQDGWHAYVDGKSTAMCPYSEGHAREDWMKGYKAALEAVQNL